MREINQSILNELHQYFISNPEATFCQGLHQLNILRPMYAGKNIIGYECLMNEPSFDTFQRLLDRVRILI